ncbi:hypothetical protein ACHAXA_005997 [Cyclostephanos tholiformis]|uniref:VWFA domain-containing protein n=1 Tax=Cyclostephanos tholiformis TaxID=382380 RepID=A0ABD3SQU1_9STRA
MGDTPAGIVERGNDEGPTADVAPPPPADAIQPLSPEPPRWRFINEAKKSHGYSSMHAGSYVGGKSSDELGARYSAPDISPRPPGGVREKPRKVAFVLPTHEPSPGAGVDVGKLNAGVSHGNESADRRVAVGKLRIEGASRDGGRDSPHGDVARLPRPEAKESARSRGPRKEWDVRARAGPRVEERERVWYDGNIRDSYAVPPGDDESRKCRGGVGRLKFRDPEWIEEEFVGEARVGLRGEGGREGSEAVDGKFDSRGGALFVNPDDPAHGRGADNATARAVPTLESPKKSTRKWICLLILLLLPIVIILGLLVGMKRSSPAGAVGSVLLPPIVATNETTTVPSLSFAGVSSEPSTSPSVSFREPFPFTSHPTEQRICSKKRDFNLCIAVDMSGSVCNDGDGSDCLTCPGASLLSTIGLASECRDTSVSEDTCCTNFGKVKEFSSIMVNLLGNFPADKSFSVVQFATNAQLVRTLSSADDTISTIDRLEYTGGMTNHESAIQTCQQSLPSYDDRKNFIMLITDGLSSVPEFDPEGAAEAAATSAKSDGSFIIPVFISPDNDLSALEFMSRLSSDGIVFDVTDFDTLSSLHDRLIDQVSCS